MDLCKYFVLPFPCIVDPIYCSYYSTSPSETAQSVTYQTGADTVVRAKFIADGKLDNTQDTNFRAISDSWPVFGGCPPN